MKDHLILKNTSKSEKFVRPGGGDSFNLPERDRDSHSESLLAQISDIKKSIKIPEHLIPFESGFYAEFNSETGYHLNLKSIETDGREIVTYNTADDVESATVFLNESGLAKLENKIENYKTKVTPKKGEPQNKPLVESISKINLASVRSLWTDNIPFPGNDEIIRWEVWLRIGKNEENRKEIIHLFRTAASEAELLTSSKEILFPENTVVLVKATARQISQIFYPINILSELRKAVDTAEFFLDLDREEEKEWVDNAVDRIEPPSEDAPAVCLLDTGVNYEHPLLRESMNPDEMDAYNPEWLITDHHGHGTGMAGLSLHSDLVEVLAENLQIPLQHRIESVKILPPVGENNNELYGEITKECVARAEIFAPNRNRVICLPVTSKQHRFRGTPSSWSAAIDEISSASSEEVKNPRLFFISAGNVDHNSCINYPNINLSDEVHNPAQAFNAITVGAYTEKVSIDQSSSDFGNQPLAPRGGLCPYSTTSLVYKDEWANKPEIVMEGGNLVSHPQTPYQTPSLRLLTTNSDWQQRYLIDFGETSAATALASRIGALILAKYPDLRPETIRGLIIHSASWTEQMLNEFADDKRSLLRCYGYGVPDLDKALSSAGNSVTLVAEDSIQPFIKENRSNAKNNEMNLHEIPWARDVLLELGDLEVEMRVTLSYFVEPNPNGKGYKNKHRYSSHQIRFATIKSDESRDEFRKRINKNARDDDEEYTSTGGDNSGWFLRSQLREKGSIHSDIWKGTAANLVTKNFIAIYPVGGWWKELKRQEKWNSIANYSLIISIKSSESEIDIYTPIENQVVIPIET